MKQSAYKAAIQKAGYVPTDELTEAVKKEHEKLADQRLIDAAFRRLYRDPKAATQRPPGESPESDISQGEPGA